MHFTRLNSAVQQSRGQTDGQCASLVSIFPPGKWCSALLKLTLLVRKVEVDGNHCFCILLPRPDLKYICCLRNKRYQWTSDCKSWFGLREIWLLWILLQCYHRVSCSLIDEAGKRIFFLFNFTLNSKKSSTTLKLEDDTWNVILSFFLS